MSSFVKVVIDTFSVVNELRVRKQASCWIVPKRWDTISLWSFVCLDFEEVWILGHCCQYHSWVLCSIPFQTGDPW